MDDGVRDGTQAPRRSCIENAHDLPRHWRLIERSARAGTARSTGVDDFRVVGRFQCKIVVISSQHRYYCTSP